ncbi:MAG: TRAP transporter small permease subunit [Rubrivivax sp.]|nr:TRAP transporter small permease subunit [Rubrivivax sp.]MDP3084214.1 TRAP transporter small permease subunit [Rubrivivax sp.]
MKRAYAAFCIAEGRVAASLLVAMVVLIFFGGLARLVGHPVNWAVDLATCLFAWACFMCADVAWRRDSLMAIGLVTERLPAGAQRACRLFNLALITAFLLFVIVMGAWLAWTSRSRSFQGIPEISYSWVTASMPFGGLLLLTTTWLKLRAEFGAGRAAAAC